MIQLIINRRKLARQLLGWIFSIIAISIVILSNVSIKPIVEENGNVNDYGYRTIDQYAEYYQIPIEEIDRATFRLHSDGFASDQSQLYVQQKIVSYEGKEDLALSYQSFILNYMKAIGLDPGLIDQDSYRVLRIESQLSSDARHVFHQNKPLLEAEAKSFKGFGGLMHYAVDNKQGYCFTLSPQNTRKLSRADYKTFQYLGNGYAVDKDSVYFNCREIEGADAVTFSLYSQDTSKKVPSSSYFTQYAHDKNRVYMRDKVVADADPKTFRLIGSSHYALDKRHVFYHGMKINHSDSSTFKLVTESTKYYAYKVDAEDERYRYYRGIPKLW